MEKEYVVKERFTGKEIHSFNNIIDAENFVEEYCDGDFVDYMIEENIVGFEKNETSNVID
jgi:hypothetical protein